MSKDLFFNLFDVDCFSLNEGLYKFLNYKNFKILDFLSNQFPKLFKEKTKDFRESEVDEIYRNLYQFFSKYYFSNSDGSDGLGLSDLENYQNQFYVKTIKNIRDFTFETSMGVCVFRVVPCVGEDFQRGERSKFIILRNEDFITLDNNSIIFNFEFRPSEMTDWPESVRGLKNKTPGTVDLMKIAEKRILSLRSDPVFSPWIESLSEKSSINNKTILQYYLNLFMRTKKIDYFIYNNLGETLNKKLRFYIVSEVLGIDEILNNDDSRLFEERVKIVKAFVEIAAPIINLLRSLEDLNRKIFLKKKFVLKSNYCITLDLIPEDFYEEISKNEDQVREWVQLYSIDEIKPVPANLLSEGVPGYSFPLSTDFLKANKNLVLDTKFFDSSFKYRLLSRLKGLDNQVGGVLIHSENFSALNLLQRKYSQKIDCIYIDPPYNTGSQEFEYQDNYNQLTWQLMMYNRLLITKSLMSDSGVLFVNLDNNGQSKAREIGETIFGPNNFINNIIWVRKDSTINNSTKFSNIHDFILVFSKNASKVKFKLLPREEKYNAIYSNPDNDPRGPWRYTRLVSRNGHGKISSYTFSNGFTWQIPKGQYLMYSLETLKRLEKDNRLIFKNNNVYLKHFLKDVQNGVVSGTVWLPKDVGSTQDGCLTLKNFFPNTNFSTPKPPKLISRILHITDGNLILDYFAGSGTTGHAVVEKIREDGRQRRYILVEMGDYFNSLLIPRLKKVVYSPSWKLGKPVYRDKGISHCFKYLDLESFEDTLNNVVDGESEQENGNNTIQYSIDGDSQFDLRDLCIVDPWDYKIKLKGLGSSNIWFVSVDLVETFNYLLGLTVNSISEIFHIKDWKFQYVFGEDPSGKKIAILWRTCLKGNSLNDEVLFKWIKDYQIFQNCQQFDILYLNGGENLNDTSFEKISKEVRAIEPELRFQMLYTG